MRVRVFLAALSLAFSASIVFAVEGMDWAYPATPPFKGAPDREKMLAVPGSDKQFSAAQIGNPFGPADWFPDEHPPMPAPVATGRQAAFRACSLCHLPTGGGNPESANLAGLNADYLMHQMVAFRNGNRVGLRNDVMIEVAKAITDEEARAAVDYYAKLPGHARQKVVESATAPTSFVGFGGMRFASPDGVTEPIGSRIIMIPDTPEGAQRRNPKSNFVAFVPPGSLERGKTLVSGAGGITACNGCHGADLRGAGVVPGIAGHHPTYAFRQLYDMQQGHRKGSSVILMKTVVSKMTVDDMIAISAYLASLNP